MVPKMTSESWLDGLAQWAHQVFVLQFDVWVLLGFIARPCS